MPISTRGEGGEGGRGPVDRPEHRRPAGVRAPRPAAPPRRPAPPPRHARHARALGSGRVRPAGAVRRPGAHHCAQRPRSGPHRVAAHAAALGRLARARRRLRAAVAPARGHGHVRGHVDHALVHGGERAVAAAAQLHGAARRHLEQRRRLSVRGLPQHEPRRRAAHRLGGERHRRLGDAPHAAQLPLAQRAPHRRRQVVPGAAHGAHGRRGADLDPRLQLRHLRTSGAAPQRLQPDQHVRARHLRARLLDGGARLRAAVAHALRNLRLHGHVRLLRVRVLRVAHLPAVRAHRPLDRVPPPAVRQPGADGREPAGPGGRHHRAPGRAPAAGGGRARLLHHLLLRAAPAPFCMSFESRIN